MNSRYKLILASLVCIVGIFLAVRTFVHTRSSNLAPVSVSMDAHNQKWAEIKDEASSINLDVVPTEDTINESAATIADSLRQIITSNKTHGRPTPHDADNFITEFQQVLTNCLAGSADAAVAYMKSHHIVVPPNLVKYGTKTLQLAPMNSKNITVRLAYRKGKKVVTSEYMETYSGTRSGESMPHAIGDPVTNHLDVYEAVVPTRVTTYKGKHFVGDIGYLFVWDKENKTWVLWGLTSHNNSTDDVVVFPPF